MVVARVLTSRLDGWDVYARGIVYRFYSYRPKTSNALRYYVTWDTHVTRWNDLIQDFDFGMSTPLMPVAKVNNPFPPEPIQPNSSV